MIYNQLHVYVSVRRVIRYEEQVTKNVLNEKVDEILDLKAMVV